MLSPASAPLAVIFGCSGPVLTPEERDFFKQVNPLGFILFSRNLHTLDQLRALIDSLYEVTSRSWLPILIDEEGGRIERFLPMVGKHTPAAGYFGECALKDKKSAYQTCFDNYRNIGNSLKKAGITVNCVPVLDVRTPGASSVVGDRSFSEDPDLVGFLGEAAIKGTLASGCQAVIKHIPGHGAATVDSHESLPVVNLPLSQLQKHFSPFQMNAQTAFWAMTAHILYPALDPDHPATQSPTLIQQIIRQEIGFQGFLLSDDLCMKALNGTPQQKAALSLEAGCDAVLYCHGNATEFEQVALGARALTPEACDRLQRGSAHPFG